MSQERLTEIIYEKDLLYTKIDELQIEVDWLEHERLDIEEQKKIAHNKAWIDTNNVKLDEITHLESNQFKYDVGGIYIKKWIVANINTKWVAYFNSVYKLSDILDSANSPDMNHDISQNGIIPRIIKEILEEENNNG